MNVNEPQNFFNEKFSMDSIGLRAYKKMTASACDRAYTLRVLSFRFKEKR